MNVTPFSGVVVPSMYFSMIRLVVGVFLMTTVWVSPPSPMTTLVEGVSITYPGGALISVITYAPGAKLAMWISPFSSVVKMPF